MALLARTAERLYWSARYLERAEDTARIIRSFHELAVDSQAEHLTRWEPLAAITGSALGNEPAPEANGPGNLDDAGERWVTWSLIADRENPSSLVNAVDRSRENLRVTREVMPREAWQVVNSLSQYVDRNCEAGSERQLRDRFLARVIDESRRFDGVIDSTMTRNAEYRLFRLGRLLERADMTTRLLGVRAATLLHDDADPRGLGLIDSEIQWMGVLRSVSALQMYQRATRSPISGRAVVRFLLYNEEFPRSVACCLGGLRDILDGLPRPEAVLDAVAAAESNLLDDTPLASDGAILDEAMDRIQNALAAVDHAVRETYVEVRSPVSTAAVRGTVQRQ